MPLLVYHSQAAADYIIINGKARLIKDKTIWETHWDKSLDQWVKKGINTPGLVLL